MNIQDDYARKRIRYNRTNSPLLPANIRGLIIGKSNYIILFPQDAKTLIIYTLTIVTMICQSGSLKDSVKMCGMVLVIITLLLLI